MAPCQIDIEMTDRGGSSIVQPERRSPVARQSRWAWSISPLHPSRSPWVLRWSERCA